VPNREWHILTSDGHSTVRDGEWTLFDLKFQAMKIPPADCFQPANGKLLEVGYAEHYSKSSR
jgi:hypothetical protein